eukprot:Colp12_sorted_trinity150504_noHs@15871
MARRRKKSMMDHWAEISPLIVKQGQGKLHYQYGVLKDPLTTGKKTTSVILHVYDITPINKYIGCLGLAVAHSGVEVYGREFQYGYHEYDASGIYWAEPKAATQWVPFRESIYLGETTLNEDQVCDVMERLGEEFLGTKYSMIYRNCNHFSDAFIRRLLPGKKAPKWVNRLAWLGQLFPCWLPQEWIQMVADGDEARDSLLRTESFRHRASIQQQSSASDVTSVISEDSFDEEAFFGPNWDHVSFPDKLPKKFRKNKVHADGSISGISSSSRKASVNADRVVQVAPAKDVGHSAHIASTSAVNPVVVAS